MVSYEVKQRLSPSEHYWVHVEINNRYFVSQKGYQMSQDSVGSFFKSQELNKHGSV